MNLFAAYPHIKEVIKNNRPLPHEAVVRLFETMPRDMAEQTVILHSLGFAFTQSRKYKIPHASEEDVFQYVVLTMMNCIKKYDPLKSDVPFVGYAQTAIFNRMMNLIDPNSGRADTIMNCATDLMSSVISTDGSEMTPEDTLDFLIAKGRRVAGLDVKSNGKELNPQDIDLLIEKLRTHISESPYSYFNFKPANLDRDLDWFRRIALGETTVNLAEEWQVSPSQISSSVSNIRLAIVKMVLKERWPEKWKWLFDRSYTVQAAKQIGVDGPHREAWKKISTLRDERIGGFRSSSEKRVDRSTIELDSKVILPRKFQPKMDGTHFDLRNQKEDILQRRGDVPHELCQGTFDYGKLVLDCYQRHYRFKTSFRPNRGLFYSNQTYNRFSVDIGIPFSKRPSGLPRTSLFPGTEPKTFAPQGQAEKPVSGESSILN